MPSTSLSSLPRTVYTDVSSSSPAPSISVDANSNAVIGVSDSVSCDSPLTAVADGAAVACELKSEGPPPNAPKLEVEPNGDVGVEGPSPVFVALPKPPLLPNKLVPALDPKADFAGAPNDDEPNAGLGFEPRDDAAPAKVDIPGLVIADTVSAPLDRVSSFFAAPKLEPNENPTGFPMDPEGGRLEAPNPPNVGPAAALPNALVVPKADLGASDFGDSLSPTLSSRVVEAPKLPNAEAPLNGLVVVPNALPKTDGLKGETFVVDVDSGAFSADPFGSPIVLPSIGVSAVAAGFAMELNNGDETAAA